MDPTKYKDPQVVSDEHKLCTYGQDKRREYYGHVCPITDFEMKNKSSGKWYNYCNKHRELNNKRNVDDVKKKDESYQTFLRTECSKLKDKGSKITSNRTIAMFEELNFKCSFCGSGLDKIFQSENAKKPLILKKINQADYDDDNITIGCVNCSKKREGLNQNFYLSLLKYEDNPDLLAEKIKKYIQ